VPDAILAARGLHTYYGDSHVLHGVSLAVAPGEVVAILGRNGMGKTTLIRSVVGFTPPRRGDVRFKGQDVTGWAPFRRVERGMALVPLLVREVGRVIGELKREGLSILLVEQNLPMAAAVADRVHVLNRGEIVYSGGPAELLANDEVKARYLGVA